MNRQTLIEIVGKRAADKIMRTFGNTMQWIPGSDQRIAPSRSRDADIVEALRHMPYRLVARKMNVDVRQVTRAAKRSLMAGER